jgi:hypothetical protein
LTTSRNDLTVAFKQEIQKCSDSFISGLSEVGSKVAEVMGMNQAQSLVQETQSNDLKSLKVSIRDELSQHAEFFK